MSVEAVSQLANCTEEEMQGLIEENASWFNAPQPGKYVLYHNRLRIFILQKQSEKESQIIHNRMIAKLKLAINAMRIDELEYYALEYVCNHLTVEAFVKNNGNQLLKFVQDKKAPTRYVSKELMAYAPHDADFNKKVSAPMFRKGKELFVFDFFSNHFEVFDSNLNPVRKVPISFQNVNVIDGLVFRFSTVDIDVKNFTQTILFDEKAGKAYAFFRYRSDNKQYLKEINLETGQIDRVITIPEYSNISDVRVYDNALYFLYDTKVYPYYRLLYRMVI